MNSALAIVMVIGLTVACAPTDSFEVAKKQVEEGKIHEALIAAEQAARERPDDPEVLLFYGRVLLSAREYGRAEWPLRKAMKFPEFVVPAGLEVASLLMLTTNHSAAIEVLNEVLDQSPDHGEGLMLRATAYAQSRLFPDLALADVERIREFDPFNVESFKPEIIALLNALRAEEASTALDLLGEEIEMGHGNDATRAWYCTTMALFAEESRLVELAESRWAECASEFPADASIVAQAVAFYDSQGEPESAFSIIRRAVDETDISERVFRVMLSKRLLASGERAAAETTLASGTRSEDPRVAVMYWQDLSGFYEAIGETEGALEAAEKALELTREIGVISAEQIFGVADLAIRQGRLDRAIALADELTVEAYEKLLRARVAQEKHEYQEALELFDESAVLWPNNAFARYHAGRAAEALGQFDRAIELYRHTTRISMEDTDAQTRLARIQLAQGLPRVALQTLQIHYRRGSLEPEGALLYLEIMGRGPEKEARLSLLNDFLGKHPSLQGRAMAALTKGMRESGQEEAAYELLSVLRDSFLAKPENGEALRALVLVANTDVHRAEVRNRIERLRQGAPDAGVLLSAAALFEEVHEQDTKAARLFYRAALDADSDDALSLARLGVLEIERNPAAAKALLHRALQVDDPMIESIRDGAERLSTIGENDGAAELLAGILDRIPHDGRAAELLCRIVMGQGGSPDRVLDLARRAARFHSNDETQALLETVIGES